MVTAAIFLDGVACQLFSLLPSRLCWRSFSIDGIKVATRGQRVRIGDGISSSRRRSVATRERAHERVEFLFWALQERVAIVLHIAQGAFHLCHRISHGFLLLAVFGLLHHSCHSRTHLGHLLCTTAAALSNVGLTFRSSRMPHRSRLSALSFLCHRCSHSRGHLSMRHARCTVGMTRSPLVLCHRSVRMTSTCRGFTLVFTLHGRICHRFCSGSHFLSRVSLHSTRMSSRHLALHCRITTFCSRHATWMSSRHLTLHCRHTTLLSAFSHHRCHHTTMRLGEGGINFTGFIQLLWGDTRHLADGLVRHHAFLVEQTSHQLASRYEIFLSKQGCSALEIGRHTMLQFVDGQLTVGDGISGHGIDTALYMSWHVDFSQDVGTTIDFLIGKFLCEVLNAFDVSLRIGTRAHTIQS